MQSNLDLRMSEHAVQRSKWILTYGGWRDEVFKQQVRLGRYDCAVEARALEGEHMTA